MQPMCLIFKMNNMVCHLILMQVELEKIIQLQAIQDGLLEADESYNIQLLSIDGTEISPISGMQTTIKIIQATSKYNYERLPDFISCTM